MLKMYGYMKCGTCRKAIKWFEERGIECDFVDITSSPPPKAWLKKILASGDYSLKQLFNTSGQQYREQNIKDKLSDMTQAQAIEMLASNGMLCKRPIVSDGKQFTVGFREGEFKSKWG